MVAAADADAVAEAEAEASEKDAEVCAGSAGLWCGVMGADETAGVEEAAEGGMVETSRVVERMMGGLAVSIMMPALEPAGGASDGGSGEAEEEGGGAAAVVLLGWVEAGMVVTWMLLQRAGMPWPSRKTPTMEVSATSASAHCEVIAALIWTRPLTHALEHCVLVVKSAAVQPGIVWV